jgi:hypothetical protein
MRRRRARKKQGFISELLSKTILMVIQKGLR